MHRRPRLLAAAITVTLVLVVPGAVDAGAASAGPNARAAGCPNDTTPVSARTLKRVRTALVCLVNAERKRFGLPAIHENAKLDSAAQAHSADMVTHDYFSHTSPSGSSPPKRITSAGYAWSTYGENIAAGYPTALAVMTGWMSDVGHCANILYPAFADIGVGAVGSPLPHFASGRAVWTNDFALSASAQPPSQNTRPSSTCPHGI